MAATSRRPRLLRVGFERLPRTARAVDAAARRAGLAPMPIAARAWGRSARPWLGVIGGAVDLGLRARDGQRATFGAADVLWADGSPGSPARGRRTPDRVYLAAEEQALTEGFLHLWPGRAINRPNLHDPVWTMDRTTLLAWAARGAGVLRMPHLAVAPRQVGRRWAPLPETGGRYRRERVWFHVDDPGPLLAAFVIGDATVVLELEGPRRIVAAAPELAAALLELRRRLGVDYLEVTVACTGETWTMFDLDAHPLLLETTALASSPAAAAALTALFAGGTP